MVETAGRIVPFNGVDSLMLGLDDPQRPQTIELEVGTTVRLVDRRLRKAVATAVGRHPMARAHQRPAKPFDLNDSWEIDDGVVADPVETCVVGNRTEVGPIREAFSSGHVALDAAPPFRLLVIHAPDGDRVLLSVNHAAFDGIGAIRLLQSISRAYAGQDDPLPDVDPLAVRGLLDEDRPRAVPSAARETRTPRGPAARRPARLAASAPGAPPGFGIVHLDLDVAEATPPAGATVNDVLVAALHLTVEQWNRSQGAACDRVSVMMPVNRRPEAWRSEVLVNLVLAVQVVSTPAERADPQGLLEAVTLQTRAVKVDGVGASSGMARTSRTPVLLRRLLPLAIDAVADRMADTAVLSNLGRVVDPPWFGGDGGGLWFSPPPRHPVILAIGAATTDDRLGISLRWCRSALTPDAAREICDLFLASIRSVRAPGSSD
ncbi:MAG: hypothetical protein H0U89_00460 [Acidimicrobiia bacterium]|nr:hypothetical protein [Acidimicrobiia bacterium]